jgi:hypothetical protein
VNPSELIRKYWVARSTGVVEQSEVSVRFASDDTDALFLEIPESDPDISQSCASVPKLADLLVLCRKRAGRRGERIVEAAGPWQLLVVELKRGAQHEVDANKAAEQIGNLAALAVTAKDWPARPALAGVVVYLRKGSAPSDFSAIKQAFSKRFGFKLQFAPMDDRPVDLGLYLKHTSDGDRGLLAAHRESLEGAGRKGQSTKGQT